MNVSPQKPEENRSNMASENEALDNLLFEAAMKNEWQKVVELCKQHPTTACMKKLTKSEETALHIAISCYKIKSSKDSAIRLDDINNIVDAIPLHEATKVLSSMDEKGNTPLHLAARIGSVSLCEKIALGGKELIELRNKDNETPLFLAAHRGKEDAFFCLRKIYKERPKQAEAGPHDGKARDQEEQSKAEIESLCRGKDGNTVLHSAIAGEYFSLACRIIWCHPNLVNSVDVNGVSPLHVLATKPNLFESSGHLKFYHSIVYQCKKKSDLRWEMILDL